MKKIEDMLADKLFEGVNFILSKIIKPDIELSDVTELTPDEIKKIKQQYGIEGIILDIDETMRENMKMIPKCNKIWLDEAKKQLKVIVVSNGSDYKIEEYMRSQGFDYIGFAYKPLKKNFVKACEKMQLKPEQVLVVGNDLFSDIYGGKRRNMKTAIVKSVKDDSDQR